MLACISSIGLYAQSECHPIGPGKARVIAIGGLNLRSAPRQASLRIGSAPYGAYLEVMESKESKDCNEGVLQPVTMSFSAFSDEIQDDRTYARNGCWVRVRYNNQVGYMLDSYLLNLESESPTDIDVDSLGLSAKYYLGFPGSNCVVNTPSDDNLNWYGIFQSRPTESASVESIKLSQFFHRGENDNHVTIASPSRELFFIIGSKKKLPANRPIDYFDRGATEFYAGDDFDGLRNNTVLEKQYGLKLVLPDAEQFEDAWTAKPLTLTRNGKTQLLNPENLGLQGPISLIWAGDLDVDGKSDFVIQYGEKPGVMLLYLSSEAGKDELVRAVAAYMVTYCC